MQRQRRMGPPIPSPPTSKGFGSSVLFEAGKPFGGQATIDFDPAGLVFELQLPLKAITEHVRSIRRLEASKSCRAAVSSSAPRGLSHRRHRFSPLGPVNISISPNPVTVKRKKSFLP